MTVSLKTIFLVYPDFAAMGGIERYLLALCHGLRQQYNLQPVVLCSAKGPLQQAMVDAGITVVPITTWSGFASPSWRVLDVLTMAQYLLAVWRYRPQVVHIHIGALEHLIFNLLGCRVVSTVHGYSTLYQWSHLGFGVKRIIKQVLARLYAWASSYWKQIAVVSQAELDRMILEGYLRPTMPVRVIANGIPVKQLHQHAQKQDLNRLRQQLGIPPEAMVLGFMNRLEPNKNPLAFLQLMLQLQSQMSEPIYAVILGEGPQQEALQEWAHAQGMAPRICWLGFQQNVVPYLALMDVAMFLPFQEGFGLGVLEAMACGTLPMATNVGGIPELLSPVCSFEQENPFLLPVLSPAAWPSQVNRVLHATPQQKQQWKTQLYQYAQQYTIERMTQRTVQMYQDAMVNV